MSIVNQNFKPITDPNINSVFASMLPIVRANPQYLNAYLLTGSPTEKLAAAMIKDMPQTKQAPPTQAPAQSVIDRMAGESAGVAALQQPQMPAQMAQAQPEMQPEMQMAQGGLAMLPLPDTMFNEESYAGGGIIAFEDGGDVPRFYEGGDFSINDPEFPVIPGETAYERAHRIFEARKQKERNALAGTRIANDPLNKLFPNRVNVQRNELALSPPPMVTPASLKPEAKAAAQQSKTAPKKIADTEQRMAPAGDQGIKELLTKTTPAAPAAQATRGYTLAPYADAEKQINEAIASEMNPATGKPFTYAETAAQRKINQEAEGVDFGLFKKQQDALEASKTRSDKRAKLDSAMPLFAAAKALTRQPRPGEAAPSLITSGIEAAGAYGEAAIDIEDKKEARDDKIRSESFALALAQNQFNAAQYSGNEGAIKEAKAAMKAHQTRLTDLGIKGVDNQNKLAADIFEMESKERIANMQERGANARTNKEFNMVEKYADQIQSDARITGKPITRSEAIEQAYKMMKFQGVLAGASQRDIDSQRDALNAELKLISPFDRSPDAVERKRRITTQLAALGGGGPAAPAADTSLFVDRTKY